MSTISTMVHKPAPFAESLRVKGIITFRWTHTCARSNPKLHNFICLGSIGKYLVQIPKKDFKQDDNYKRKIKYSF